MRDEERLALVLKDWKNAAHIGSEPIISIETVVDFLEKVQKKHDTAFSLKLAREELRKLIKVAGMIERTLHPSRL